MGWQNWPYWLKFGLIFLIAYVVLTIPFVLNYNYKESKINENLFSYPSTIINLPAGILLFSFGMINVLGEMNWEIIPIIFINGIIYFLICVLIGAVYNHIFKKE